MGKQKTLKNPDTCKIDPKRVKLEFIPHFIPSEVGQALNSLKESPNVVSNKNNAKEVVKKIVINDSIFMGSPAQSAEIEWLFPELVGKTIEAGKSLEEMEFKVTRLLAGMGNSVDYIGKLNTVFTFYNESGEINLNSRYIHEMTADERNNPLKSLKNIGIEVCQKDSSEAERITKFDTYPGVISFKDVNNVEYHADLRGEKVTIYKSGVRLNTENTFKFTPIIIDFIRQKLEKSMPEVKI